VRIAHLSDLHLLDLEGAVPHRLFNKRLTGYANLRLKRGHKHKPEPVTLAARRMVDLKIDHLVVTGDVSNLALEREFDRVKELLEGEVGLGPDNISIVPGNHDVYTSGSVRAGRFAQWFARYMTSDIDVGTESGFPFVRLRGPAAIIGLSTAVSRPPLMASGQLGKAQIVALERVLKHPEVKSRTPVILQHHPIHNPASYTKTALEGLWDAQGELKALRAVERGLLLHGHWHRRVRTPQSTERGSIEVIGATSASLLHEDNNKMAGFNVYEITDDGAIGEVSTFRFDQAARGFDEVPLPRTA
jgi:3',5'-cyclic AMP phosphodiesterase CpdA